MKMLNENSLPMAQGNADESLDAEIGRLARMIHTYTPHDGTFSQRIPGLHVCRYSRVNVDCVRTFDSPSLLIVAQGAKVITVGQEVYQFGRAHMLMFPVALPIAVKTTHASYSEPFLSVKLNLDPQRIAELALKVYPQGLPIVRNWSAGYVINADLGMVKAVTRLVECLSNPSDAELLAPLVMDEILIRVLRSPFGVHIAEICFADSVVQRVVRTIAWLRDNFSQQMKVTDLAKMVHMSESSFHEHFKAVTSMSPLQYQKALRLHEARRLMVSNSMDANTACRLVGYVSTSQFSRDYSRFFGSPPRKDVARLRQQTQMSE
ncbi:AraC family transcriptional regulator [Paenibacillus sp. OAS669]|uniref:AraC family transcriptional regulator n=1 Tax=Paenibacillus sp. OAS669 TaxID=2663821 RepID=UPI00178B7709|nr:AraC family transcriptional regulator [Paenibacillus sp. OAS669]MBE1442567.1 AraC-like DNA-binding protein [Paenibacillus sp. OAS669]